jgi:hypothetical protein
MENNLSSENKKTVKLPTLGDNRKREGYKLDKFNFKFSPNKGEYLFGWQSTPSALVRAMPIILLSIIALIIFAFLSKETIFFSFFIIMIIIVATLFVVIVKPDRAVIVDTYGGKIGDSIAGEIIGNEVDYHPAGDISLLTKDIKGSSKVKEIK